jgi:hypothetical protein
VPNGIRTGGIPAKGFGIHGDTLLDSFFAGHKSRKIRTGWKEDRKSAAECQEK